MDEGVAGGHGVLRGVVAHADLEGREELRRQGDHVAELAAVGLLGLGAGVGDEARLGAHKPLVVTAVADDCADGAGKAAEDALMELCPDGMCLIFIQLRVSTLTDVLLKPYLASMCIDNGRVGEILCRETKREKGAKGINMGEKDEKGTKDRNVKIMLKFGFSCYLFPFFATNLM